MNENAGDLVAIYDAPDQGAAYAVVSALEEAGIPAVLMDEASVWGGQGVYVHRGYYARVAVPNEFAERGRELLAEYRANAPEAEEETPGYIDTRYTERSHRGCCGFMAALSVGAMAWVLVSGYTVWLALCGGCALSVGLLNRGYLQTTPPRFHNAIRLHSLSYIPMGVALLLGAASAKGLTGVPTVVFYALCMTSTAMFIRGATTKIPES